MNILDRSELPAAPDGGPPLRIDTKLLDQVPPSAVVGPVRMLGARVLVRCQDADLGRFLGAFLAAFPPAPDIGTVLHLVEVAGCWVAYQDGARTVSADSVPALARGLVWQLNALALAAPSADVHVHAAVAARRGRAVLFPGCSGAGKTTLVTALVLAGWTYLSDEVAALDVDGPVVRPYPRALALEPGSWALVAAAVDRWPAGVPELVRDLRLVLPASLGTAQPAPAEPVAIVFPEVVPGASTRLEPLGRAEAFERLLGLTFNLRDLGPGGFHGLAARVGEVTCHRLRLDGVGDAAACLAPLLAATMPDT